MSRVIDLLQTLNQKQDSKIVDGFVNRYVNESRRFFKNKELTKKYIQIGIKLLVVEKICQTTIVSTVFSFIHIWFRNLKLKKFPLFERIFSNFS